MARDFADQGHYAEAEALYRHAGSAPFQRLAVGRARDGHGVRCDQQPRDGDARGGRPGRGASPPTPDSRGEPRVAQRSAPEHAHVGQQLGARPQEGWRVGGGRAARRDVLGASHEDTLNSTFNLAWRRATSPEPSRSTARCFRRCGLPSAAGTLTPSTPCKASPLCSSSSAARRRRKSSAATHLASLVTCLACTTRCTRCWPATRGGCVDSLAGPCARGGPWGVQTLLDQRL
mmetsp:Transcript_36404/g.117303  ORF Transcript_36404/g.117303 Transcript_36404/m.117303 type:complete len:232 (+) Transcript_36404:248-943(+)